MNCKQNISKLKNYFPPKIGQSLLMMSCFDDIHEIRMRVNRPLGIVSYGTERFLTGRGGVTDYSEMCVPVTPEDMEYSFRAVCDYSIHSYKREISEGFITLEGGNRVGICGTAVTENGKIETLKYISGLNFRISGQAYGCADEIYNKCFCSGLKSLLIIGPPMSGKTTVIKDLCRILGGRYRISVIDERGEIGAVYHGVPQNNVGRMTDVFDGYPKSKGILTAVRVMSPDIVVCDEIGGEEDCSALLSSSNTGVKVIASVHGGGLRDVIKRKNIDEIIKNGIFECFATLGTGRNVGKVIKYGKAGEVYA